jgi:ribosomal protein L29
MEMSENEKKPGKNFKLLIGIIVALVLIVAGAVTWIVIQSTKITEMTEMFDLEKEELTDEYSQLAVQYEGYELNVNNDSIIELFEAEKMKVQRLREELRTVKSTNTSRISELKKELATVRGVLKTYIAQVDSLNKKNSQLQEENQVVTRKFHEARSNANQLSKEKEQLSERVTMASQLDATNIIIKSVNKKGKDEKKVSKVTQLNISFIITKNITAPTGEKSIYVRIAKPDDDVLVKSAGNVFMYENKNIAYSIRKDIEYSGEEQSVIVYWKVEEFLEAGSYRVDIFADGNLIGKKSFSME